MPMAMLDLDKLIQGGNNGGNLVANNQFYEHQYPDLSEMLLKWNGQSVLPTAGTYNPSDFGVLYTVGGTEINSLAENILSNNIFSGAIGTIVILTGGATTYTESVTDAEKKFEPASKFNTGTFAGVISSLGDRIIAEINIEADIGSAGSFTSKFNMYPGYSSSNESYISKNGNKAFEISVE